MLISLMVPQLLLIKPFEPTFWKHSSPFDSTNNLHPKYPDQTKMYLLRRYDPRIIALALLIAVAIVVLVATGEGFKSLVARHDWDSRAMSRKVNRQENNSGSTLLLSFPWK